MAEEPNPDAAPFSTEFHSALIESLREALDAVNVNDEQAKVEAEIEASKVHWSDLASSYFSAVEGPAISSSTSTLQSESESDRMSEVEARQEWELQRNLKVAEDNVLVFRSLQEQYPGGFFFEEEDLGFESTQQLPKWMTETVGHAFPLKLRVRSEKPFAEGAQAELFHADYINKSDGEEVMVGVMKVFKEGTSLRDLLRLLPPTMLADDEICRCGYFGAGNNCSPLGGARLFKSTRRLAFIMERAWGDLRKLINVRKHMNNQGQLFPIDVAIAIMFHIAKGMQNLHAKEIVHRDLKAANVLVFGYNGKDTSEFIDPILLKPSEFSCFIADYECSAGVVGTRFWRAPEILLALKDQSIHQKPKLFSKESDVYSFGMTCYEILSGDIPFEGLCLSDYDGIIGGIRPILPNQTAPWMKDLVSRCWHKDPSMRPTFDEIVEAFRQMT